LGNTWETLFIIQAFPRVVKKKKPGNSLDNFVRNSKRGVFSEGVDVRVLLSSPPRRDGNPLLVRLSPGRAANLGFQLVAGVVLEAKGADLEMMVGCF
jgi:hypothetical protein